MSVFQSFREILKQRIQALLWRSVASDVETDALLQDMANLDRLEAQACQYEAEGKQPLANLLRQRAARLDADSPGGSITAALQDLAGSPESTPLLPDSNGRPTGQASERQPAALPRPGRSRRRRSGAADEARED